MTDTPAAIRIDVDGTVTILPDATYDTLHDSVGGWIESIPTNGSVTIFVNEEGKLVPLPLNPLGHALWAHVASTAAPTRATGLPDSAS